MNKRSLDYILKIRIPIVLFVVLISFLATFYISRAERDGVGYQPIQPINFSHKLHAGKMRIDCQYCHTGVKKERHALVPSVNICMNCHTYARKNKPEIIKLTNYYKKNLPIPWKRVHRVPQYVYFNHSAHVNSGIKCRTCHGNVEQMTRIKQVKSFTMSACIDCHRNPLEKIKYLKNIKKGPVNCWTCHR